jgi:hypothetical protein
MHDENCASLLSMSLSLFCCCTVQYIDIILYGYYGYYNMLLPTPNNHTTDRVVSSSRVSSSSQSQYTQR